MAAVSLWLCRQTRWSVLIATTLLERKENNTTSLNYVNEELLILRCIYYKLFIHILEAGVISALAGEQ